ncbi:2 3 4 5-tetrahydropyridine-2 6-dicarboxylate N-succinyltransferase [Bienertia sinuspersici]
MNQLNSVLNGDPQFFDSKPLIMKAWDPDMKILKEDIRIIPMWIKLPRLDIKYWGVSCLEKIVSGMRKLVKLDNNTKNRERLLYARMLVDMGADDAFPDCICFENEKGVIIGKWLNMNGTCYVHEL